MSCYVDPARSDGWCHLTADTEAELHEMAENIGLKYRWYQGPPKHRHMHYDLRPSRRRWAIAHGAIGGQQSRTSSDSEDS